MNKKHKKIPVKNDEPSIYIREAENKLTNILGAQVKITTNRKHHRIQIDFATEEDLSRIIENFENSLNKDENNPKASMSTKEEKIAALRKFSTSQNFNI